ncbi:zinc-ribbon domain-containing protein [Pontibacter sp. CAU 1760]
MSAPAENRNPKTCPNCGEAVPAGAKQCPNCGQLLGSEPGQKPKWFKTLTPTELFLLVLGSLMLGVFLVAL